MELRQSTLFWEMLHSIPLHFMRPFYLHLLVGEIFHQFSHSLHVFRPPDTENKILQVILLCYPQFIYLVKLPENATKISHNL